MRSWEQRRDSIRTRIAELESEVEADEQRGAELAAHLERLERQLKTVIAPREAEALMHEIATFTDAARRPGHPRTRGDGGGIDARIRSRRTPRRRGRDAGGTRVGRRCARGRGGRHRPPGRDPRCRSGGGGRVDPGRRVGPLRPRRVRSWVSSCRGSKASSARVATSICRRPSSTRHGRMQPRRDSPTARNAAGSSSSQ